MADSNGKFSVGGVMMPVPFKIRRFAHTGLNLSNLGAGLDFYTRLLGFRITDAPDLCDRPPLKERLRNVPDTHFYFLTHGSDHHALLLMHPGLYKNVLGIGKPDYVTLNQLTWQVGTFDEVVKGCEYARGKGVKIERVGRETLGNHWFVYMEDPDGHSIELLYGITQIGWDRFSKPVELQTPINSYPDSPPMTEENEVDNALSNGVRFASGYEVRDPLPAKYNVGGIMLPRPFKVTKLGPIGIYVKDLARSEDFYAGILGFIKTEEVTFKGRRCVFMRNGNDHHTLALFPAELRGDLGMRADTSLMSLGLEVGSYGQLRDAVWFLKENGVRFVDMPSDLYPGIDYAAHVLDPEGHCIQLYYYMEQIGWDGKPRPKELRRKVGPEWPETVDPLPDTYVDQTFQGPLG